MKAFVRRGLVMAAAVLTPQSLPPLQPLAGVPIPGGGVPLRLDEVLAVIDLRHPTLEAAAGKVRSAEGQERAAGAAFDPNFQAQGWAAPSGYYRYGRTDFVLSQATPVNGASLLAGWRLGRALEGSSIPGYYGHQETLTGGEFRAGLNVPLLRDGPIDARRAGITRTGLLVEAARAGAEAPLLRLRLAATEAWTRWAAAGARLRIARSLLALAEDRDRQIGDRVAAGALAAIEHLENRRTIMERRQGVVAAVRTVERTALTLAFHWRDEKGQPRVPDAMRLPLDGVSLGGSAMDLPANLQAAVSQALAFRPELARWRALVAAGEVQAGLADNQVAPRFDLSAMGSVDVGGAPLAGQTATVLSPPALEVGVTFQVPLGQREARGRAEAARADLGVLSAEARQQADQTRIEVQDAWSAVQRSLQALEQAQGAATVAGQVAEGERQRFQQGLGTLLLVNLREMAAARAEQSVVDAEADLGVARAQLRAAVGLGGSAAKVP